MYKIDQLTAIKYVQAVWNEVRSEVIYNFWRKVGLLDTEEVSNTVIPSNVLDKIDELQMMVH